MRRLSSNRSGVDRNDHREVFAEFAMVLMFLRAEQLAMHKGQGEIEGGAMKNARSTLPPCGGETERGKEEGRGSVLPPSLTLPRKGGGERASA